MTSPGCTKAMKDAVSKAFAVRGFVGHHNIRAFMTRADGVVHLLGELHRKKRTAEAAELAVRAFDHSDGGCHREGSGGLTPSWATLMRIRCSIASRSNERKGSKCRVLFSDYELTIDEAGMPAGVKMIRRV
jgi:hypothetical protein